MFHLMFFPLRLSQWIAVRIGGQEKTLNERTKQRKEKKNTEIIINVQHSRQCCERRLRLNGLSWSETALTHTEQQFTRVVYEYVNDRSFSCQNAVEYLVWCACVCVLDVVCISMQNKQPNGLLFIGIWLCVRVSALHSILPIWLHSHIFCLSFIPAFNWRLYTLCGCGGFSNVA